MMSLQDFENGMSKIQIPPRNDRDECERSVSALLKATALGDDDIALHARHIALAIDLFRESGISPLYLWIDDRDQSRYPSTTLPYDITLATALHRNSLGIWSSSIWEMAHRDKRINLVLHHIDLESPFGNHTPLLDIFAAAPPSHTLYQDLRFLPYRYKPDTDNFLHADSGPLHNPAQLRFLRKSHRVDTSVGHLSDAAEP